MHRVPTLTCLAIVALLSACGSPAAERTGEPVVHPRWTGCPADAGTPAPPGSLSDGSRVPLLPSSFVPVAVYVCRLEPSRDRAGGRAFVLVEERANRIGPLVAALRLPDQPLRDGACTAEGIVLPWIAVVDARGRWVHPGVPTDPCGKPRAEVLKALHRIDLRNERPT